MLRILVGLLDGTSNELNVKGNDRISDVKANIECITGIYWKEQRLIFNGKELNNEFIVKDVGIMNGSKLFCLQKIVNCNTQIFVNTLNGDNITVNIKPNDSVKHVKSQIESHVKISDQNQRFIFEGKILQDNELLGKYNIFNGNTIHLVSVLIGGDEEAAACVIDNGSGMMKCVRQAGAKAFSLVNEKAVKPFWEYVHSSDNTIYVAIIVVMVIAIIIGCCVKKCRSNTNKSYSKVNTAATDTDTSALDDEDDPGSDLPEIRIY